MVLRQITHSTVIYKILENLLGIWALYWLRDRRRSNQLKKMSSERGERLKIYGEYVILKAGTFICFSFRSRWKEDSLPRLRFYLISLGNLPGFSLHPHSVSLFLSLVPSFSSPIHVRDIGFKFIVPAVICHKELSSSPSHIFALDGFYFYVTSYWSTFYE